MVGFGYPFERLLQMTFTDIAAWMTTAIERNKQTQ